MDNIAKIEELQNILYSNLSTLVNDDYVLWDLPYHGNIGDTLIWEGEREFLRSIKYKCLDYSSSLTCTFPKLPPNVIILLHGGGNFGDVWREAQNFRLKVVEKYSNNRIIVFPQTVFYYDESLMLIDAAEMRKHKNLTICARDYKSFNLLKSFFSNQIMLLPDMAFCISKDRLIRQCSGSKPRLLINRKDKESIPLDMKEWADMEIRDWPTIEKKNAIIWILCVLLKLVKITNSRFVKKMVDLYSSGILRPSLINIGIRLLSCYQQIYTTRLHAMILSILLLKKNICFLDNNYGKCRSFYDSWLKDLDSVQSCKV